MAVLGFHSDNMGAVVGTLTMQTKQRRPSRGTLVQGGGMERRGDKRATKREQPEGEKIKEKHCSDIVLKKTG